MKTGDKKTLIKLNNYLRNSEDSTKNKTTQANGIEKAVTADNLYISNKSREIQKVREMVDEIPDIRIVKVNELKASVENGTYYVNTEVIAENMITRSLIDSFL